MAKLLITTQTYENYGAHDWDGTGQCPTVMGVRGQIECDNYAFRETIIDWTIVADDALTEFEQSQLDYEGKIRYGSKEIAW